MKYITPTTLNAATAAEPTAIPTSAPALKPWFPGEMLGVELGAGTLEMARLGCELLEVELESVLR